MSQEENRKLLAESSKTRATRNARNLNAGTIHSPAALQRINRARAKAIAQTAIKQTVGLVLSEAEARAFEMLELNSMQTDDFILEQLKKKFPQIEVPKPKTEKETPVQQLLPAIIEPRKIHFVLPFPPSANRYWRHAAVFSRSAGKWIATTYVSEEAKTYKELIRLFCQRHKIKPMLGNIRLTAFIYRPQKSGDLGNRLKVLEDALENIAYINDSQIVESHHFRRDDKTRPRAEIFLEEIP